MAHMNRRRVTDMSRSNHETWENTVKQLNRFHYLSWRAGALPAACDSSKGCNAAAKLDFEALLPMILDDSLYNRATLRSAPRTPIPVT